MPIIVRQRRQVKKSYSLMILLTDEYGYFQCLSIKYTQQQQTHTYQRGCAAARLLMVASPSVSFLVSGQTVHFPLLLSLICPVGFNK